MDALQSSAASLGLFYSRRAIDDPNYIYNAVIRLIAKIPTMIAAFQLIRKGQDPIQPRDDLTYSSNFLYMLTEKEQDPIAAKVFDRCLILHAEHSLNASTFSARVTASTLTDPYAVIASAVGTLAGPLHGLSLIHISEPTRQPLISSAASDVYKRQAITAYGSVRVLAVTLALNVLAFKLCSACRIKHLSKTFAAIGSCSFSVNM